MTPESIMALTDPCAGTDGSPPLDTEQPSYLFPLSFAQMRLWFLDRLEPGGVAYNLPIALKLSGCLNVTALERAFNEIVKRHEVLRTTFPSIDSQAVQLIHPYTAFSISITSLDRWPPEERDARAKYMAHAEAQKPFDLSDGPLLRIGLLWLDQQEHVLLLTMHHIVSDDWSIGLLTKEIAALYTAYSANKPSPLPELAIQYADFAVWQRDWLQGEVLDTQRAYWAQQLADLPVLNLPVDRPRPPVQSYQGACISFQLTMNTVRSLNELSRNNAATIFMALLAIWQVLLSKYTGQDDIVVGSPIAGRNRAETSELIGFFVNTLVLRTDIAGDPTFAAVLRRVREMSLAAYAHQDIPFEQLVEDVAPVRDLGRHPLFQVMISLQQATSNALSLSDLTISALDDQNPTAKFDLSIDFCEVNGGLAGIIEYAVDLFEPSTIQRMVRHLHRLIESVIADPVSRLSELSLLTDSERRQVLVEFNDTPVAYDRDARMHHFVENHAALCPDALAVACEEDQLTYAALNASADRLAAWLRLEGCGPDAVFGILAERGITFLVAVVAIFKAGGAYLPLDPASPPARTAAVLEQSGASRVLVARACLALYDQAMPLLPPECRPPSLVLGDNVDPRPREAASGEKADSRGGAHCSETNIAYVIYTSGTTGIPKGVMIDQCGMMNHLYAMLDRLGLSANDRVAQTASQCFDISVWQFLAALMAGGSVHIYSQETVANVRELPARLQRDRITVLEVVPTMMLAILADGEARNQDFAKSIRWMIATGEMLPPNLAHQWIERFPGTPLMNAYGPAECSDDVTLYTVPSALSGQLTHVPVGTPIQNTQVYILDRHGMPLPVGIVGELYIGGDGVGRGYRNEPYRTASAFVPDPFRGTPGQRMYRSGDLGRFLPDGAVEMIGRSDTQVKLRGFRIELGEIDVCLARHPSIAAAVTMVRQDVPGRQSLVAYLVADAGQEVSSAALRAFLKELLPEYMVPSLFVFLEALPTTANGKVDRAALPEPTREPAEEYSLPRTLVEEILADIWASVLGRERVGVHDNFFELGGDSILTIQIVARANQAGIGLTLKLMFQHQTIAEAAAVCATLSIPEAEQGLVTGLIPLTPIQRWFFDQKMPDAHHYNQSVLLETTPLLQSFTIMKAIERLVAHHDVLRVRYSNTPDGWLQSHAGIGDDNPSEFSAVDLSEVAGAAQRKMLEQVCECLQASLDMETGRLIRVCHFVMGPGRPGRLLIVVHHLVMDGVSWRILLEDLQLACSRLLEGMPIVLPSKTTSFQGWSEQLLEYAQSARVEREAHYWAALPWAEVRPLPLELLADDWDLSQINVNATSRTITEVLSSEQTRALLQDAPEAYHTQINDILLAALAATLCRWARRDYVMLTLEGHGREDLFETVNISRTIGWFTTEFPVFLHWTPDTQPSDLLISTKEMLRSIPEHGIGYGLLRYLGENAGLPVRDSQVIFNYLGQFDQVLSQEGMFLSASEHGGPDQSPRNPLTHVLDINAMVAGGQLRVEWTYSGGIYQDQTVRALASDYLKDLEALIVHCQSAGAGTFTPSDFPDAKLSMEQLRDIFTKLDGMSPEAIYPLSPMQQGFLFHTLYSPGSGEYIEQAIFDLRGDMDFPALQRSWRQVVKRHSPLRTVFVWERLAEPVQVVCRDVDLAVEQLHWNHLRVEEQAYELERLLKKDAEDGFDLSRAPLMRVTLIHTAPGCARLLWTHHHLLLDGWCVPVLIQEVLAFYRANMKGEQYHPGPARPYREYIQWLAKQDTAKAEEYWRKTLESFTTPTPLPGVGDRLPGHESSDVGVHQYSERLFEIAEDISERLRTFAQQNQLTINTLFQGAWSFVLSTYSGLDDVLFGATVSGRPSVLPGIDTMLGLFINTLPVRIRVPIDQSIVTWLQSLQAEQAERSEYEYTPLTSIHGWSGVPRSLPLFESLMVFANFITTRGQAESSGDAHGLRISNVEGRDRTNYPLTVVVIPGNHIGLKIGYHLNRYTSEDIERLGADFIRLLPQIAASPTARLRDLSLLSDSERHQLLFEFNDTQSALPMDLCVHQLFEDQVRRTPDAIAVVFDDRKLTYSELNARANQVAHYLQRGGVGPETCVGLMIERSLEMVVGLLGILKAGGAYIPLDPDYPASRLMFMLRDSGARFLVTVEMYLAGITDNGARIICVDRDRDLIASYSGENPESSVCLQNLAYVIYTSGSSGKPKGVGVCHGGLTNYLLWSCQAYDVSSGDGTPVHSSLGFDLTITSLFPALVSGQRILLLPPEQPHLDLQRMLCEAGDWTLFKITPAHLAILRDGLRDVAALGGVRALVIGGEALHGNDLLFWRTQWGGIRLINEYGPTETVVGCCVYEVTGELPAGAVPIGRPIWNTQVYVLNSHLNPVPLGVPGELYIGGAGLARGYLGQPELTAERFVPHPFSHDAGARLYRTGDLCRYLSDGNLEYLGRIDHQVKVRGFRIELGEIEAVLSEHSSISTALVLAREDNPGDKRLTAYVVGNADHVPDMSELRNFLRSRLPEYMVPSAFVLLDSLPLTANGKVNRNALPAPDGSDLSASDLYEPPINFVEEVLVGIWRQVLDREHIDRHGNFFDLGGHSLLATHIVSQVREQLGVTLRVRDLFASPTVALLSDVLLEELLKEADADESEALIAGMEEIDAPVRGLQGEGDGKLPELI